MPIVLVGFRGDVQEYTIQETGARGVTLHVVEMGEDYSVSTQDTEFIAAIKSIPERAALRVPVKASLSTYGGTAKIKFRLSDKPQVVQQGAR